MVYRAPRTDPQWTPRRRRYRSQPPALGQSAGGRQNDRAALPGSCWRCCSRAATAGRGGSGFLRRVRRGDRADYNAVGVVLEGEGSIGAEGKLVIAGDVAWLTRGDSGTASQVAIRAQDKPLRALLYAGRPPHNLPRGAKAVGGEL